MKFKKFMALICTFAFTCSNLINGHADITVSFIGCIGTGKSSVVNKIWENTFNAPKTVFSCCESYTARRVSRIQNAVWDTVEFRDWTGPAQFSGIMRRNIGGSHIVVIVFDVANQDSIDAIGTYERIVRNGCGDIPIILVANKSDRSDFETCHDILLGKIIKYNIGHKFIISAKTGEGIIPLGETIFRLANGIAIAEYARKTAVAKAEAAHKAAIAAYNAAKTEAARKAAIAAYKAADADAEAARRAADAAHGRGLPISRSIVRRRDAPHIAGSVCYSTGTEPIATFRSNNMFGTYNRFGTYTESTTFRSNNMFGTYNRFGTYEFTRSAVGTEPIPIIMPYTVTEPTTFNMFGTYNRFGIYEFTRSAAADGLERYLASLDSTYTPSGQDMSYDESTHNRTIDEPARTEPILD
ncbi:MAG: GTPase domain-containing protein [Oscillospiraceae bacterium]|nr:GTPase domain-containing protein [Oscillospiraceae bacterium]